MPTTELREASHGPDLSRLRIDDDARLRRTGGRWLRWFFAALGILIIVAGAVFAMKGRAAVVEVATARPPSDSREVLLNATGYVTPRRRATVAAKITGRVTHVYAEEGLHVTEGQVLATLDDSDARVRLVSAQADRDATAAGLADLQVQLANADRELHRTRELADAGVSSPQALDLARTTADSLRSKIALMKEQVVAAEKRVSVAQQDVDNCIVRSPFTGIVVTKDAQVGEIISPISAGGGFTRTGIATVVDMNSLEIEVDVNEANIARVLPGKPVTAILDAYPDWKIPATVRTVIPTADRQKATVKVRVAFDKLDPRILPDMGVKVTFLGDEPKNSPASQVKALVPQGAVRKDSSGSQVVFLYHEDGRIERRAVRAGSAVGSDEEILAGLAAGDQVVVGGPETLHDGQKVEKK